MRLATNCLGKSTIFEERTTAPICLICRMGKKKKKNEESGRTAVFRKPHC